MIGEIGLSKKGMDIDGIIEEYKVASGGNVSAGDFVSFFESFVKNASTPMLYDTTQNDNTTRCAVALDDKRVFIAFGYNKLYGVICTINNGEIELGTITVLSTVNQAGRKISAVKLSNNKIFIAHSYVSVNDYWLNGMVCTINGITITVNEDKLLDHDAKASSCISAVALSSSKVFIAHTNSSSKNLYGTICTISENLITKETSRALGTSPVNQVSNSVCAVKLSNNKIFVAFDYSIVNAIVCKISGNTIEAPASALTELNSDTTSKNISVTVLDSQKVFITYNRTKNQNLYGMICTINDITITVDEDKCISSIRSSGTYISTTLLNDTEVIIIHSYEQSYYLSAIICKIEANTSTILENVLLSESNNCAMALSAVKLDNKNTFIICGISANTIGLIFGKVKFVNKIANNDKIFGIAKTSGIANEIVEVYTPNLEVVA